MKKAIITGSTGLVGIGLANKIMNSGVDVLCLGSKERTQEELVGLFGRKVDYLALPLESFSQTQNQDKLAEWSANSDCTFYHLAWRGLAKLSDGSIEDQMRNAYYSAFAVQVAKQIGCQKFVNVGSTQESYYDYFLSRPDVTRYEYGQSEYSIAKAASRDMCKIQAYLSKIDYIHVRLSVPLDFTLKSGGFISNTLKTILSGSEYDPPVSKNAYDIVSLDDVAHSLFLLGKSGQNKADYYVGPSMPLLLTELFDYFSKLKRKKDITETNARITNSKKLPVHAFDNSLLQKHTGFSPSDSYVTLAQQKMNL